MIHTYITNSSAVKVSKEKKKFSLWVCLRLRGCSEIPSVITTGIINGFVWASDFCERTSCSLWDRIEFLVADFTAIISGSAKRRSFSKISSKRNLCDQSSSSLTNQETFSLFPRKFLHSPNIISLYFCCLSTFLHFINSDQLFFSLL